MAPCSSIGSWRQILEDRTSTRRGHRQQPADRRPDHERCAELLEVTLTEHVGTGLEHDLVGIQVEVEAARIEQHDSSTRDREPEVETVLPIGGEGGDTGSDPFETNSEPPPPIARPSDYGFSGDLPI
jgi:hypothetical protein